jgi:hypothetical protein
MFVLLWLLMVSILTGGSFYNIFGVLNSLILSLF